MYGSGFDLRSGCRGRTGYDRYREGERVVVDHIHRLPVGDTVEKGVGNLLDPWP